MTKIDEQRLSEQRAAAQAGRIRIVFQDQNAIRQAIESAHGPGSVSSLQRELQEINGSLDTATIEYDTRTKSFSWVRSSPTTSQSQSQ